MTNVVASSGKQRTRSYIPKGLDTDASRETYKPIRNESLVRPLGVGAIGDEYLRIGSHVETGAHPDADLRRLYVVTDTVLEMNGLGADLRGDALFVFNALAAARDNPQKSQELYDYGSGFRTHTPSGNLATYFLRAIQALDAWSRDVSELDLVHRTGYGSGSNPKFMLQPDLDIIDRRD